MSLQNLQNFLARLLTEENLRRNFLSAPDSVGSANDLTLAEIEQLKHILPEQLSFFAGSLVTKRLHEVEKLLPLTRKILDADFKKYFREFAPHFNPQTIKKHLEDAAEFAVYLQKIDALPPYAADLAKYERARLLVNSSAKRYLCARFDFDIRAIVKKTPYEISAAEIVFQKRKTFAFWVKINGKVKHFFL